MKNPLNKLFVPLVSFIFLSSIGLILHSCSQEKQSETKDNAQTEAIQTAWEESGEWVQKLT